MVRRHAGGTLLVGLLCLSAAPGCGPEFVSGGSTTTSGHPGGGAGGDLGGGGAGEAGGSAGRGGAGGGDGGGGSLEITITEMDLHLDCQPPVAPDPLTGWFKAAYDNQEGTRAVTADIAEAHVLLEGATTFLTWSFDVSPAGASLAAGEIVVLDHAKEADSGAGVGGGHPCAYCVGGATFTLGVEWYVEGHFVERTGPPRPLFCAQ